MVFAGRVSINIIDPYIVFNNCLYISKHVGTLKDIFIVLQRRRKIICNRFFEHTVAAVAIANDAGHAVQKSSASR